MTLSGKGSTESMDGLGLRVLKSRIERVAMLGDLLFG